MCASVVWGEDAMVQGAVDRGVEREYRNVISDNLRWNDFLLRPGDIVVCTPPKCGTTWMQAIVAEMLHPEGGGVGYLWEVAPWIDARWEPIDQLVARLDAQEHRRLRDPLRRRRRDLSLQGQQWALA
jgi:hypothetical protein